MTAHVCLANLFYDVKYGTNKDGPLQLRIAQCGVKLRHHRPNLPFSSSPSFLLLVQSPLLLHAEGEAPQMFGLAEF